jgi:hypothetical protein
VSPKSRLRRLDAGVRWLETDGVVRRAELVMKVLETTQAIADHKADDRRFAARWRKNVPSLALPKPRVKVRRPRVRPLLRDAAVAAAPRDEGARVAPASQLPPRPPPPRPPPSGPPPRWTKDIRPGPHDVLNWDEAMQVPWVDSSAADDGS